MKLLTSGGTHDRSYHSVDLRIDADCFAYGALFNRAIFRTYFELCLLLSVVCKYSAYAYVIFGERLASTSFLFAAAICSL